MTKYRSICWQELDRALFAGFVRRQEVTRCWRKVDGAWVIRDVPFVDDWNEIDYAALVDCLRRTLAQGGFVYGAFQNGILKGFVSVEAGPLGRRTGRTKAVHFRPLCRGKSGILQKNGLRGGGGI